MTIIWLLVGLGLIVLAAGFYPNQVPEIVGRQKEFPRQEADSGNAGFKTIAASAIGNGIEAFLHQEHAINAVFAQGMAALLQFVVMNHAYQRMPNRLFE